MRTRLARAFARTNDRAFREYLRVRMHRLGVLSTVLVCGALVTSYRTISTAGEQSIAGAWNVTIVFDNPALVGCTTPGLLTADGGDIAAGCDVSESPGYGQWRRTGNGEFAITFVGVNFGAAGTGIVGTYKVRSRVTLNEGTLTGPFLAEVFAPDGTVLVSETGRVIARRIGIEPF
jgi:hypothetical protein